MKILAIFVHQSEYVIDVACYKKIKLNSLKSILAIDGYGKEKLLLKRFAWNETNECECVCVYICFSFAAMTELVD